jgi:hypothetical protein
MVVRQLRTAHVLLDSHYIGDRGPCLRRPKATASSASLRSPEQLITATETKSLKLRADLEIAAPCLLGDALKISTSVIVPRRCGRTCFLKRRTSSAVQPLILAAVSTGTRLVDPFGPMSETIALGYRLSCVAALGCHASCTLISSSLCRRFDAANQKTPHS